MISRLIFARFFDVPSGSVHFSISPAKILAKSLKDKLNDALKGMTADDFDA